MNSVGSDATVWQGVWATRKNRIREYEKPNEDFALVDDRHQIYLALDGVSRTPRTGRPYASPSPAAVAAEMFASTVHAALLDRDSAGSADPGERLRRAAAAGNAALAEYNRLTFPQIDYLENNPAGCVGVLSLVEGGHFHYAYLGDCSGRVFHSDGVALFTCSQTTRVRDFVEPLGLSGDERTVCIRRDICNNRAHDCGYGVFNGAPGAMEFLVSGSIPLTGSEVILLTTDGMDLLLDNAEPHSLLPLDPENLLDRAEQVEQRRPDVRSDDKTVVVVRSRTCQTLVPR